MVYITRANEVSSGFAANVRDDGVTRPFNFTFGRAKDPEKSGRQLEMLVIEADATQRESVNEREAKATQRILKAWRGYLKDRADLETRRGSGLKYVDRQITGERVIFTTEMAAGEHVVGQDRLVQTNSTRIGGRWPSILPDVNSCTSRWTPPTTNTWLPSPMPVRSSKAAMEAQLGPGAVGLRSMNLSVSAGSE